MITIPPIRRELTGDLLARHIYLLGEGSSTTAFLRRLAPAGAQEGTVALSETGEARLSASALFRPHLTLDTAALFSVIATLALAEAVGDEERSPTPIWPSQVTVEGEAVGRSVALTDQDGDSARYVILGAEIEVRALERVRRKPVDGNTVVAAFLNALDKWTTAYTARGPAAVRGPSDFFRAE